MVLGKTILARAASVNTVQPKAVIRAKVDYCVINDAASHRSIDYLNAGDLLYDNTKVAVIIDHDTPSGSEAVSVIQRKLINFAKKFDTIYYHGEGVGCQLLLDSYVKEGEIVVGCGEHTAVFGAVGAIGLAIEPEKLAGVLKTGILSLEVPESVKIELNGKLSSGVYAKDSILAIIKEIGTTKLAGKIIEFSGEAFRTLTLNDRITICNLACRTSAVSAVVNLGQAATDDAYAAVYRFDLGRVKASVAKPDNYEDIVEVKQLSAIAVNEVFIGGCSGGRIEDLRIAANIVKGKKVARGVRLMVAPITSNVYIQALNEGLITDFIDAGAIVMNQGCSVCWGKSQGIIDSDEVLVSAGSYNYKGCAGAQTAKVYIASAATAATSALTGKISEPNNR